MKLAKYLADYIEHECDNVEDELNISQVEAVRDIFGQLNDIIQQGIEAFESTEVSKVLVVNEKNNLLDASKHSIAFLFGTIAGMFTGDQCAEMGLYDICNELTVAIKNTEDY